MKIVLAAPLYPPEVGGPAKYAFNLAKEMQAQGHSVTVVRYGVLKQFPTGIRHLLYACKLLPAALWCNAIIAFDTYSVGLPAALVATLVRKPLIIRVGGDFLWEQYVQRTKDLVPLPHLYQHREKWGTREKLTFSLMRWTLAHADAVFNSPWLKAIWEQEYGVQHATVIENEIAPASPGAPSHQKNILFFSRQITLKNNEAFRRAFERAKKSHPELVLEEGMVFADALAARIKDCYAVAVPSISDVAPNFILDALRSGKPFILTKYSGYAERFGEYGVIVDPLDEGDMQRGIEELAEPETYERLSKKAASFAEHHRWHEITREFLALITV